MTNAELVVT